MSFLYEKISGCAANTQDLSNVLHRISSSLRGLLCTESHKILERGFEGGIVLPVVFASLILSCRLYLESVKNKMQKKAFFLLFNPVVLSWLIVLIMKDNKESK